MTMNPVTVTPLDWRYMTSKPIVTLGDTGYATLSDAITTIGADTVGLVIPPGSHAITTQLVFPPNLTLIFVPGAYFDLTGLLDAEIGDMSVANPIEVTVNGHGLSDGHYVRFQRIMQNNATATEWMSLNNTTYVILKTGDNTFTLTGKSSAAYQAYVPATDSGRVCLPIAIQGAIIADRNQKIFSTTSRMQVTRGLTTAQFLASKQLDWYPEWFGALADGSDDIIPVMACVTAVSSSIYHYGNIHLNKWYSVSDTVSINDMGTYGGTNISIVGNSRVNCGFKTLAGCYGKPVVEVIGTSSIRLKSFGICGGSSTTDKSTIPDDGPSVGLLMGRSIVNANGGDGLIEDMNICGFYQYGAILNAGYATSVYDRVITNGSALTGKANNNWAFSFFMGSTVAASTKYAVTPTNTYFKLDGNPGADGNHIKNCSFTDAGTKTAGATVIYLYSQGGSGPVMDFVFFESNDCDYHIYAEESDVWLRDGSGDYAAEVAGIYLTSATPGQYRKANIYNYTNKVLNGINILTDNNVCLSDCTIDGTRGNNGFTIQLGDNGAAMLKFINAYTMTSFVSSGRLLHCHVEIPNTCSTYTSAVLGYNNTFKIMVTGHVTTVNDGVKLQDYA